MQIQVPLMAFQRVLFWNWAFVVVAGYAAEILRHGLKLETKASWADLWSLSYEGNIPTWYSSCLLFLCSMVLAAIAAGKKQDRREATFHWWLLAACFLYISLDEAVSLHEQMNSWFDTGGVLYFGWVIPAAGMVLVLGFIFLKFLFRLPKPTRVRFIWAGAIYVTGALLMELPLGYWVEYSGSDSNLVYALLDGVEEGMELLGATLFLVALLKHIELDASRESGRPAR